jgi:hypothetical protein
MDCLSVFRWNLLSWVQVWRYRLTLSIVPNNMLRLKTEKESSLKRLCFK